jgi:hypothetical protein
MVFCYRMVKLFKALFFDPDNLYFLSLKASLNIVDSIEFVFTLKNLTISLHFLFLDHQHNLFACLLLQNQG